MSGRGIDVRVVGKLRQQGGFLAFIDQADVDDVNRQQFGFLAGVKTALEHVQLRDRVGGDTQTFCGQSAQTGFGKEFGVVLGWYSAPREGV